MILAIPLASILALLLACAEPAVDPCADAPIATWDSFGSAFVTEHCQTCHASTSPDRLGAPEDVVFDEAADVWAEADAVLARAAAEPPTMPPEGGTTEDDRVLLRAWLECGTQGE